MFASDRRGLDLKTPGLSYPGGFADEIVVPSSALARIPEGITAAEAAPMGCAGVTTFKNKPCFNAYACSPGRFGWWGRSRRLAGVKELSNHRVDVTFVGPPPARKVPRASGVTEVEVEGDRLRCLVCGSFQPFLEALHGSEVISLTFTQSSCR